MLFFEIHFKLRNSYMFYHGKVGNCKYIHVFIHYILAQNQNTLMAYTIYCYINYKYIYAQYQMANKYI